MDFIEMNWPYIILFVVAVFVLWKYRGDIFKKGKGGAGDSKINQAEVLSLYTTDLTQKAKDGKIDPVVGRTEEIERVIQILSRRKKNNPLLIGSAGVGKTAIVEGLALRIVTNDIPGALTNKKVLSLNLADMIGGTKYRGEFEERVKMLVDEIIIKRRNIILFIDEIHTLIQSKGTEGAMNIGDILKPALARGELQSIGATTTEEYDEYIKKDDALARRFQLVEVDEPTVDDTIAILKGIKKDYEDHHRVKFTDESVEAAVNFTEKFIKERLLPDKAIDVMDEAGALVNLRAYDLPDHALKLIRAAAEDVHKEIAAAPDRIKGILRNLEKLKIQEEKTEDQDEKKKIKSSILDLTSEIQELEMKHKMATMEDKWPEVTEADVKNVLSGWLKLPIDEIK
ncbi:ATP-dependent Clp protease ATP-binding subunit [Candidatus Falkowbacteria bacterium]|jgi:ATP-dependent Clp protease ATP-binding subunit ClpC|nr:ATP-dependent Clp protease ATP-binding subunit [Candidatus Falkowbacteria bacterium]MBT5503263.1 ATP-dependent Clp protease ATP-binding subunit [Candidatus Falkowbacteria bacterium]MBT6574262.1 ATP-dependent Clp protease ATP-binding subunit [Candidatus Falkowbacteria bacterium]MBT7348166.1 ATP-dependent Clp protease ATP-binding subunit [Candidatus Falkowbacteria bacterium]MBT7500773.1 ATP-dependent Clp protease ATP-binding subunit [Candidatus Falkowbacteria bacterium]